MRCPNDNLDYGRGYQFNTIVTLDFPMPGVPRWPHRSLLVHKVSGFHASKDTSKSSSNEICSLEKRLATPRNHESR